MHKETNRFKTYTQLEKTYRKILVRWPRGSMDSREPNSGGPRLLPLTRQYSCEWESRNR